MAKWEDYVITKVSFDQETRLIEAAFVYDDYENHIKNGELRNRAWLVAKAQQNKTFCTATKNVGGWNRTGLVTYQDDQFRFANKLPKAVAKTKVFISYYHNDDQEYKNDFNIITSDLFTNKSVQDNDIDTDNSDEYISQLINRDFLTDVSVLIVLVGPNTKCRKHVDWEISGALNLKVGDKYAGIIGILLPTHPDYGKDHYDPANLPQRLAANAKSGYAKIYDWTTDRVKIQDRVDEAFMRREEDDKIVNHGLVQLKTNLCD